MYISYNWLQDFIKLPAKTSFNQVAEKLTAHTVEVESIQSQADRFNNIVVGKVLEVKKHPNASKLKVATLDVKKDHKLNIVCGAPNIRAGQLVPVALNGTVLPGGLEIKTSKIRGEISEGMVCAEDELGLGIEHSGIMVLDKKAKIGEPLASYLRIRDNIFEIDNKSLSNRPDLFSHYGLARELAATFSIPLKPYEKIIGQKPEIIETKKDKLSVEVLEKNKCWRYMALKIDNIKVEPSPVWLKDRLTAINQRPINNIVDLANYVMFDCGQPLHTFNASRTGKIVIKNAIDQENIETLDGKERELTSDDLVISDGREAIAIAGIIGGKDSQIIDSSSSMILESANFSADTIRKTVQRLGLRTEASLRFEKCLDPSLTEDALYRFLTLLLKMCPEAKIIGPVIDIYNRKIPSKKINFEFPWLITKIGQEIPKKEALDSLYRLGFEVEEKEKDIEVVVPSWRATKDIKNREDVLEEVLRVYGYDNIKSTLPKEELFIPEENKERSFERKVKDILYLRFPLSETHNHSFVGEEQLKKLDMDFFHYLKLINPLSEINSMLRQSLAPGLFYNVKNNQAKSDDLGFFEVGNVFFDAPGEFDRGDNKESKLPYQEKRIGIVLAGKKREVFSELKSIVTNFLQEILGVDKEIVFSCFDSPPGWSDKKITAKISILDQEIGWLGSLSQKSSQNLNLKMNTSLAEINFNELVKIFLKQPKFRLKEIAKYPPVVRDLCFVVSNKILYNDIKEVLSSVNPLIKSIELFDIYSGDKLSQSEKSLAFHLSYQAEDRTLTSAEVDKVQDDLIKAAADKFGAKLRNF